ncbi:DUF6624 domain-containing protein [Phenylobacterium sp.]|uniref:DUF6624 domain-containing protein n=1 Tax=Phenylobacterium sp. TaxID=1871053 RepID=UPI002810B1EA|nr:DUF6624 domain-containing protein [Phenylobacterium sp.]
MIVRHPSFGPPRRARRLCGVLLVFAAIVPQASPADAQEAPAAAQAGASRLIELGFAELRKEQAAQRGLAPASSVAEELARRVRLDQAGRRGIGAIMQADASLEEKRAAIRELGRELAPMDEDNTRYLKGVLPADGWFRISRDGDETARNAWLIVQHSQDRAFQQEVLKRMEPLAKIGEVRGADFALLYDRLEVFAGRPQRYGSQASCENGVTTLHTLEDASKVDEWRRSVGLGPLEEYKTRLGVGRPC